MAAFLSGALECGGLVRYRFKNRYAFVVTEPSYLHEMLIEHRSNYVKPARYHVLRPVVGLGLLLSEGATWRGQRTHAQPVFARKRISKYTMRMTEIASEFLDGWGAVVGNGAGLEIEGEMNRLTQLLVGEWTMGPTYVNHATDWAETLAVVRAYTSHPPRGRLEAVWPSRRNREFKEALGNLNRLLADAVETCRRNGGTGEDFLSAYLHEYNEAGEDVSDNELRDQLATMFIPGHESSSSVLPFAFCMLSRLPDVRRRVEEELDAVLGGQPPTPETLPRLTYCDRFVKEVLRLYPVACSFSRAPRQDDVIGGFAIPAGSTVIACAYTTHRLPAYWDNPEGFDPDRHAAKEAQSRPQLAYYPFGVGQRRCIGEYFGTWQVLIVMAMVLQRFRLDLVPGHRVELDPGVVLRPKYGMRMTVKPLGLDGARPISPEEPHAGFPGSCGGEDALDAPRRCYSRQRRTDVF